MKRQVIGSLALALAVGFASPAAAGTTFGFQIGIVGAPAPPRVVYVARPSMVFDPDADVYMVQSPDVAYDEFNVGPYWYVCSGDYWYRSTSYRGPFVAVDVRMVPTRIFSVAPERWHSYPARLARWHRDNDRGNGRGWGWGHDKDRDQGRGHGHGWGRDKDRGDGRDHGDGRDRGDDHGRDRDNG